MQIETTRLTLREFAEEDYLQTNVYESDPDVVRWQSHDPRTPDESRAYIRCVLQEQAGIPRRLWDLAVVRRSQGAQLKVSLSNALASPDSAMDLVELDQLPGRRR